MVASQATLITSALTSRAANDCGHVPRWLFRRCAGLVAALGDGALLGLHFNRISWSTGGTHLVVKSWERSRERESVPLQRFRGVP